MRPFVMWTLIIVGCLLVGGFVMRLWERGKLEGLGWALIRPRPLPSPFGVLPQTPPVELPPREPRPMDVTEISTESWEEPHRADDVRESTDERITLFGEALAELPVDLSEATLDPRVRAHAEAALVCYEQAKRGLEMDGSPRLRNATAGKWLDDGFHHLAAINALRAGEPSPEPPPDLRCVEP